MKLSDCAIKLKEKNYKTKQMVKCIQLTGEKETESLKLQSENRNTTGHDSNI